MEGVGDHGCEYMTGGRVVVLGPVGRNFGPACPAASPTSGTRMRAPAHASTTRWWNSRTWPIRPMRPSCGPSSRCTRGLTGSLRARRILDAWAEQVRHFVKVMPLDYKRALAEMAAESAAADEGIRAAEVGSGGRGGVGSEMGKVTGFREYDRQVPAYQPVEERIRHWREFALPMAESDLQAQGARCMDCGVPFCHDGCPLGNIIPDFNDHVYQGRWRAALESLTSTNDFPEFTGRVCPAPCESACVLGINRPPVAIKSIEVAIIERAFSEGWMTAGPPHQRTGRSVAVVGSGPAGLAAAAQLDRAGHSVTVFERADRVGGLLRYGIPDFKLSKDVVERRIELMAAGGISFRTGVHVGVDYPAAQLVARFDAVVLAGGSTTPRDLPIPGRELPGVEFAMDFLRQANRRVAGDVVPEDEAILASGKDVVVIGGGDTGSDCVGTSIRQGARSVTQIEIMPKPAEGRTAAAPPGRSTPARACSPRPARRRRAACATGQSSPRPSCPTSRGALRAIRAVRADWGAGRPDEIETAASTSCRPNWCSWPWASCIPSTPSSRTSAWT